MQERRNAWPPIATAVAFSLCVYTFYSNSLCALYGSYDTGWIARTGEFILKYGFPQETQFTWAVAGQPYVAYQWLFAVATAIIFQAGSLWLVGFVACLLAGVLIFLVLPRIWTSKNIPLWMPLLVLAFVQTPHWFNARPQLISFFLLAAFLGVLEKFRHNRPQETKWLLALPPLMVLWVNLHSFWFLGLGALLIYFIADYLRSRKLSLAMLATIFGCAAATGLNPYKLQLLSYTATFINGSQYNKIYELLPWATSPEYWWTLFYVPFVAFALWKQRKSVPVEGMIITGITCIAALCMRRFEPVFVIASWPYLGAALAEFKLTSALPTFNLPRFAYAAAALAVPVFSWYWHCPTMPAAWMVYTEDTYPLLKIMQQHTAQSRVFVPPNMGSWLLAIDNTEPVFVDSRFDAYPKRFLKVVDECLEAAPNTLQRLNQLGFEHVLVRDDLPLAHLLISSPDWDLALDDSMVSWWVRTGETEKLQLSSENLPPHIASATAQLRNVRSQHLRRIFTELAGNGRNQVQ